MRCHIASTCPWPDVIRMALHFRGLPPKTQIPSPVMKTSDKSQPRTSYSAWLGILRTAPVIKTKESLRRHQSQEEPCGSTTTHVLSWMGSWHQKWTWGKNGQIVSKVWPSVSNNVSIHSGSLIMTNELVTDWTVPSPSKYLLEFQSLDHSSSVLQPAHPSSLKLTVRISGIFHADY